MNDRAITAEDRRCVKNDSHYIVTAHNAIHSNGLFQRRHELDPKQRSLHALAQLHQGPVEVVDSDKPQTRIFDIENDVNRNRHDERKAKHM